MYKAEIDRIHTEYERRARDIPEDFYTLTQPVNLFSYQQRSRALPHV
jgi:hypothetical protein